MDVSPITRKLKLLHYTVKNGLNWSCGLDGIVHMDDTAFFMKDNETGLLPFMLAVKKIPKATFSLLMEYLEGVKGGMRERVNEEAVRRALRYKTWEKNKGGPKGSQLLGVRELLQTTVKRKIQKRMPMRCTMSNNFMP